MHHPRHTRYGAAFVFALTMAALAAPRAQQPPAPAPPQKPAPATPETPPPATPPATAPAAPAAPAPKVLVPVATNTVTANPMPSTARP